MLMLQPEYNDGGERSSLSRRATTGFSRFFRLIFQCLSLTPIARKAVGDHDIALRGLLALGIFIFGVQQSQAQTACDLSLVNAYAHAIPAAPGSAFTLSGWSCQSGNGLGQLVVNQFYPPFIATAGADGSIPQSIFDTAFSNGENCAQLIGKAHPEMWIYSGTEPASRCRVQQYNALPWYYLTFEVTDDFNNLNPQNPPFKQSFSFQLLVVQCSPGSQWTGYGTLACTPAPCPAGTEFAGPSPGSCQVMTCPEGQTRDPVTGVCEAECPVPALAAPPFNDACAEVLENINSTQAQKDAACGALSDKLKTGMACFRDKLSGLSPAVPLKITSDIRDIAYQAHLRDIWDKMEDLVDRMNKDPAMRTACAARRAEVAAEKGCDNADRCTSCYSESATRRSHCLKGRPANPSPNDAQHTQGNAFDVSETYTIDPLQDALDARNPPQDIQQYLDAPTDCKLNWGGNFDDYDPVHFLAR
ncbi:MAG: hypothetical protein AAB134_05955 [Pseudomonadota bacterium]